MKIRRYCQIMRTPSSVDLSPGQNEVDSKDMEIEPQQRQRHPYSQQTDSWLSRVPTQMNRGVSKTQLREIFKRLRPNLEDQEFEDLYNNLDEKKRTYFSE